MPVRLRRLMVVCACAAAAGPLVLTGGPAGAAPLDFDPAGKIEARCFDVKDMEIKGIEGLVPAPGDGAFTPYFVNNGQVLVPTSFQLTSDAAGLKSRHLLGDKVTKPGRAGSTTCYVLGWALDEAGNSVPFAATIVGNLVGKPRPVTAP